jgi:hypothetical protein
VLTEKSIAAGLREIGYARAKPLVYKATWSAPEVEHFLFFTLYGTPKEFLAGDFGVRNCNAQAFGVRCAQAYGGEAYRLVGQEEGQRCYMRFPLGKLAGWKPRWSLTVSTAPEEASIETIKGAIRDKLFPLIRDVTSVDRLMSLLAVDDEPVRWLHVNGAMRAAQIAYLARELGVATADIRSMLRPREIEVSAHLAGGKLDPASYIDRVIEDSGIAVFEG